MNNIGIPTKNKPTKDCSDENCPFHGHLKVRGRTFEGEVASDKMASSVTVTWAYTTKIPKFERLMRSSSTVTAHNPSCINAKKGDRVRIAECRPISKNKTFVVIEKLE